MAFKKISIIIPAYNEERFIEKTIKRVIKSNTFGLKKEIIVINDGSSDKTGKILQKLSKTNRLITIINKRKNEGKTAALKSGILKSTGDIVLVQDADLEYHPENYPLLLKPFLENDADVVYGSRFLGQQPHRVLYFWHYVGNLVLTTISNIFTNLNLSDIETGFKVFRGDLIKKIAPSLCSTKFGFEPEVTAKIAKIKNLKIYEVGISYWGRTYQEGKKITWRDGLKAIWEIIRFNLWQ